jgi:hypothetical protein
MAEIVYYTRHEASFESFQAENYIDYMTNVMPIPERHIFYIISQEIGIICEVTVSDGDRVLLWRAGRFDKPPENAKIIEIDEHIIKVTVENLIKGHVPSICPICEKNLGRFLRLF